MEYILRQQDQIKTTNNSYLKERQNKEKDLQGRIEEQRKNIQELNFLQSQKEEKGEKTTTASTSK